MALARSKVMPLRETISVRLAANIYCTEYSLSGRPRSTSTVCFITMAFCEFSLETSSCSLPPSTVACDTP